jgi:hypothetical protein
VSSYANPESLNRFAYVLNNPLRYTDPTGHKETECSHQSDPLCSAANGASTGNTNGGGGNGNGKNKGKHGNDSGGDITLGNGNNTIQSHSYCGGGPNGLYNFLDCGANITQDVALAIDAPFAGLDGVLITAGCFAGPEGCAAGAGVADTIFNISGANADETVLSFASMIFSVAADFADDRHLGQDSVISGVAAVGGAFSPDPILDFAIDGFGSAYNHEVHPIYDIFNH